MAPKDSLWNRNTSNTYLMTLIYWYYQTILIFKQVTGTVQDRVSLLKHWITFCRWCPPRLPGSFGWPAEPTSRSCPACGLPCEVSTHRHLPYREQWLPLSWQIWTVRVRLSLMHMLIMYSPQPALMLGMLREQSRHKHLEKKS